MTAFVAGVGVGAVATWIVMVAAIQGLLYWHRRRRS